MRRIVTGHDSDGNSIIVSDGEPPRTNDFTTLRGFSSAVVWSTEPGHPASRGGADTTADVQSVVPGPGGTRLITLAFPPDAVRAEPDFDGQAMGAEFLAALPGLAEVFAPNGIHTTHTVDYVIVVEGEMWLETDGEHLTRVQAGDIVVQNATRHAWRNLSDKNAVLAVVFVGVSPQ